MLTINFSPPPLTDLCSEHSSLIMEIRLRHPLHLYREREVNTHCKLQSIIYYFSSHPQILFVRKSLYQRFSIGWPFRYLGFLLYSVQCTKNLLLWSLSPQEDNRFLILFRYLILDKWICNLDCFNFQRTYSLPLLNSQDTVQDICTVFWNSIFGQGRGRLKVGFFPCRTWLIIQTNLTLFDFQLYTYRRIETGSSLSANLHNKCNCAMESSKDSATSVKQLLDVMQRSVSSYVSVTALTVIWTYQQSELATHITHIQSVLHMYVLFLLYLASCQNMLTW